MSHVARLFIDHPLTRGTTVYLPEGQSKYLIRVMRLPAGATVRAFNGVDGEWVCTLDIQGKSAALVPLKQTRQQDAGPELTLLFAPVKKARTDFIVEKATELGVTSIQPVLTDYTQTNRVRTDRMRAQTIEAAEQTERMDLPQVHEAQPLPNILANWTPQHPLIYCDEASEAKPLRQNTNRLRDKPAGVLIGPEGGFSPKERQMLRALDFVIPISLGPRILRAETAVVSALTLWQSEVGDWQKAPYLPET